MSADSEQSNTSIEPAAQDNLTQEELSKLAHQLKDDAGRKEILKTILDKPPKKKYRDSEIIDRPAGHSKASVSPYYKERFALQLKPWLDKMIENKEDIIFLYSDFNWVSKNSLYLLLNQAFKYLLEHMDPDGKYAELRQIIEVRRAKDTHGMPRGVSFQYAKDVKLGANQFKGTTMQEMDKWRQEMEEYLESGEVNQPFYRDKLVISRAEREELEDLLSQFADIIYNITANSIKLVRIQVE